MLSDVTQLARDAVTTAGYGGLVAAMVAENLFPPIPSEIVLPLAGFEVAEGRLEILWVLLAATAGSVLGALVLYALGRFGGRAVVLRWGRVLRVGERDLDRAETWFARWGDAVVLGGRMVPLGRSVVSIPAGMARMPLGRFTVLTAVGSLGWNALLVGAGHQLGAHWDDVASVVGPMGDVMLVVCALAAAAGVVLLLRRRRQPA